MQILPPKYDDDKSGINEQSEKQYLQALQNEPHEATLFVQNISYTAASSGKVLLAINQFNAEVTYTGRIGLLLKTIHEKEMIISDLTAKLKDFERIHNFMPSKPHLPNGYFSDLLDEDEYYD